MHSSVPIKTIKMLVYLLFFEMVNNLAKSAGIFDKKLIDFDYYSVIYKNLLVLNSNFCGLSLKVVY